MAKFGVYVTAGARLVDSETLREVDVVVVMEVEVKICVVVVEVVVEVTEDDEGLICVVDVVMLIVAAVDAVTNI